MKSELNHFLPTGGLKSVQSRKLGGCKKLTFFPGTAQELIVILITYEAPTRPAESDFNHSENPHNAPCEQAQKVRNIYVFSLLHYLRFVSPPNRKVIKITHKSSPFPASDYNHFALNELLINK